MSDPNAPDHDKTVISPTRDFGPVTSKVAALVVVSGAEIGRLYPLRRNKVVLGRGNDADILLKTREVSRRHAQIKCVRIGTETLYQIVDLGSTNHVYVNGERTDAQVLQDDDKIHLGDIVLKFELLDPIDAKYHQDVRNRIQYDDLTALLTYESFRAALEWELDRYANEVKGCAVVMMDLDDFKKCNDTHGHLAGSFILRNIGRIIAENFRHFDVSARYGGEEFVAYLPETQAPEAFTATERVRKTIEQQVFPHQGRDVRITISMGISHFPDDGRDLETLVQAADERLYRAKREGKNRVIASDV